MKSQGPQSSQVAAMSAQHGCVYDSGNKFEAWTDVPISVRSTASGNCDVSQSNIGAKAFHGYRVLAKCLICCWFHCCRVMVVDSSWLRRSGNMVSTHCVVALATQALPAPSIRVLPGEMVEGHPPCCQSLYTCKLIHQSTTKSTAFAAMWQFEQLRHAPRNLIGVHAIRDGDRIHNIGSHCIVWCK